MAERRQIVEWQGQQTDVATTDGQPDNEEEEYERRRPVNVTLDDSEVKQCSILNVCSHCYSHRIIKVSLILSLM